MFTRKTWKNTIAEFLNRRTITNTASGESETVDVTRAMGNVTEQGDAFNAQNMNDLESRISDAFSDVDDDITALNSDLAQFGQTWDLLVYNNSTSQVYVPVNLSGYKFVAFCLTSYEHIAAQTILPVSMVSKIHSVSALINATNNPVIISYNGSTTTSIAVRVITQDAGIYAHVYGIK